MSEIYTVDPLDPDWAFSPDDYVGKDFYVIDGYSKISIVKDASRIFRFHPSEKELIAGTLEVEVEEGNTFNCLIKSEGYKKTQQVYFYDVIVRENAQLNLGIFAKNGKLVKHVFNVILESGASFNAFGHIKNDGDGTTEIISKITHSDMFSSSMQTFTCEASNNGQTLFQSNVLIEDEADNTSVGIDVSSLTSGYDAKCFVVPQVFNKNGTSTVDTNTNSTSVDPGRMHYLQSRGLTKAEANELITNHIRNTTINIVPEEVLKHELRTFFNK